MMVGVMVDYSTTECQILNDMKIQVPFQRCLCVCVCNVQFPLQHINNEKEDETTGITNYCKE